MWVTASLVYWSSLGVLGYTYAGYPILAHAWSRIRPKDVKASAIEPSVSIVLAVRNEERHIRRKLDNLLALDYPTEKLRIIVVSDGSTDETDAIVASFADRGVVLEHTDPGGGKALAINRGVQRASGEIVVFCDARQEIAKDALRALVPLFADPTVGAVSGELQVGSTRGPGAYWRYEKIIRTAESRIDSVVGATGALYAIRRHLFVELPPGCLLDDVFTPMQIAMQGFRVLFAPQAKVYDAETAISAEFSRKVRTLAGNFQLLEQLPGLLNPRRNRLLVQLVSHKLLRLACPFALTTLLASNALLVATGAPGWPFYSVTLAAQATGYGLAGWGALAGNRAGRLAKISHTFVSLHAAAVVGLLRYLKGDLRWT